MNWSIDFTPLFPMSLLALLGIAGLLFIGISLYLGLRGSLLRLFSFCLLLAALFNPVIRQEEREPLPDIAVLISDETLSQKIAQRPQQSERAKAHLLEQLQGLANTELRQATVRSLATAENDGTQLFAALKEALSDVPPERYAGALIITDGQIHDIPASIDELGYNGPLHALITGYKNEKDRRIILENAPKFGIVGQTQTVRFKVEQKGAGDTGPVPVSIAVDGKAQTITVNPGVSVSAEIPISHGGENLTEIVAAPLEGEITLQNNRAVVSTKGVRERLRVLLISGEPHPGERTWRNLLKADASVDLVHFTILRPPEKQDGTPIRELSLIAFPTRELFVEKLDEFDLIIFDRYKRRGVLPLTYLINIAEYVERGGAVLVAAGPDYARSTSIYRTPLADILPAIPNGDITETAYKARITERGQRHPVTRDLPGSAGEEPDWGRWFRLIDSTSKFGEVVMSGPGEKPLMTLARHGEGRVAQLMSDHAWLWARGYEGGGPQAELLRRAAHWLMREPALEEEAFSGVQKGEKVIVERRTMEDQVGEPEITLPSGKSATVEMREIEPGLWRGELDVEEAGVHRIADTQIAALFSVGSADAREFAELKASGEKLAPIIEASNGSIGWLQAAGPEAAHYLPRLVKVGPGRVLAGSGWLGLKANGAYRVESIATLRLFSTLLALAALLALISLLWYREGR